MKVSDIVALDRVPLLAWMAGLLLVTLLLSAKFSSAYLYVGTIGIALWYAGGFRRSIPLSLVVIAAFFGAVLIGNFVYNVFAAYGFNTLGVPAPFLLPALGACRMLILAGALVGALCFCIGRKTFCKKLPYKKIRIVFLIGGVIALGAFDGAADILYDTLSQNITPLSPYDMLSLMTDRKAESMRQLFGYAHTGFIWVTCLITLWLAFCMSPLKRPAFKDKSLQEEK